MAKFALDAIMDAALNEVVNNADQVVVCNGQPATYADATTDSGSGGNALGEAAIGAGDFTLADGDTSGRKYDYGGTTGIDVDVSATADNVAFIDDTNSRLLVVTTISNSQSVTAGNTMDVQAFDHEIQDPS